jgi:multidrug efflux pump subunit AcrA (membrane-fusion protein)
MRIRHLIIWGVLFLLAMGACGQAASGSNATPTAIPTAIVASKPTYEVQRGDIVQEVEFIGRVAPVVEKELFFKAGGFVKNVFVAKGDQVAVGQVIAELENVSDLERQRAFSQYQVRLANLDLIDAELDLELFEMSLASPEVLLAEAALAVAEADDALRDAQRTHNALTSSTPSIDRALVESELALAEVALADAQAEHDRLLLTPFPIGYPQESVARQNAVERAQIQVDLVALSVEDLDDAINDARLVAPFDGQILILSISEGRTAEAFQSAVVIADTSTLEVTAELTGNELNGLSADMPVRVELFLAPGAPVEGTIRQLPTFSSSDGGSDDADLLTRIQLAVPLSDTGFELDDRVRIRVVLDVRASVLWLPPQAIRTFEGRNFVVVQGEAGQQRIDIKLGLATGDRVEIVLVEGVANVDEGQVVIGP